MRDIKNLKKRYEKFWVASDDLENAKNVLRNYCSREKLKNLPGVFQRLGKFRTPKMVRIVEDVLKDSSITSVEDLLNNINKRAGLYSADSSLARRIQFICHQLKIPFQLITPKGGKSFAIQFTGVGKEETASKAVDKPKSVLHSFAVCKKYELGEEFKGKAIRDEEDRDYKSVEIVTNLKDLLPNEMYLYVVAEDGRSFFAPQMIGDTKLTHAGLLRMALKIAPDEPTPPVIASGAVRVTAKKAYCSLASGHFLPEESAYLTVAIAWDKQLQALGKAMAVDPLFHKTLDPYRCTDLTGQMSDIKAVHQFKTELHDYLIKYESESIKPAGYDNATRLLSYFMNESEEDTFSEEALSVVKDSDEELYAIVARNKKYCPEAWKEPLEELSDSRGMSFS